MAGLLIALRWRHTPPTPVAVRLNQVLRAVLITGLVALPIVYLIYRSKPNAGSAHGQPPVRVTPLPDKGSA